MLASPAPPANGGQLQSGGRFPTVRRGRRIDAAEAQLQLMQRLATEARELRSVTPVPAQRSTFGSNPAATAPLAASPAAGMTANAAASGYSNGSSNGAHATAVATTPGAIARLLAKHGLAARPPPHEKPSPPGQLKLRFDA